MSLVSSRPIASPITSRRPATPSGSSAPKPCRSWRRVARAAARSSSRGAATDDDLLRVHDAGAYRDRSQRLRGRAAMLDPDTFTSPETDEIARLAAGAVVDGVDRVLDGPAGRAALRAGASAGPSRRARPGDGLLPLQQHRRRRRRGARARRRRAWRSSTTTSTTATARSGSSTTIRSVLFVSSHQFPFYPGTGAADEIGARRGAGLHGQSAAGGRRHRRRLSSASIATRRCRCCESSRRNCCWSRPASTRTSAIRWPACE